MKFYLAQVPVGTIAPTSTWDTQRRGPGPWFFVERGLSSCNLIQRMHDFPEWQSRHLRGYALVVLRRIQIEPQLVNRQGVSKQHLYPAV